MINTDGIRYNNTHPGFKGPLDGAGTILLRTLDTNPMANAVGIDMVSMVIPRTFVDSKRNKYAGAETFFREFTGTFIVCLSASFFAKMISKIANKIIEPELNINTKSWFSKNSLELLSQIHENSKTENEYFETILDNVSGFDGEKNRYFKDIDWKKVEWIDEKKWSQYKWDNQEYKNLYKNLKNKDSIIETMKVLTGRKASSGDSKKLLEILQVRLTNALQADKLKLEYNGKTLSTSAHNILRDSVDMSRDIFRGKNPEYSQKLLGKISKINNIKSIGALVIAAALGLTNQYVNRKITEKRTGTKGFVGDNNFKENVNSKQSKVDKSKEFLIKRIIVSAGMAAMALLVMRVKSLKDFMKKLEFTGPVTGGNAIKTVYAATLIGRFMASDTEDELRETATRDYLGFLNWLVFGGFAAKGTANLLDRKRKDLFNTTKQGKGLMHWLNDISLKSHNEIAAKGKDFAKKNMWKLNLAQSAGLAYSTVALGILLPKLNIWITNRKNNPSS